jgi:hypothetical protein
MIFKLSFYAGFYFCKVECNVLYTNRNQLKDFNNDLLFLMVWEKLMNAYQILQTINLHEGHKELL